MALDIPKIDVVSLMAAKLEATTGTDEALTAAEAGFIVYNLDISRDENGNARELMGSKGANPDVAGSPSGKATFEIELAGSDTAATSPPWATTFLPACDMVEAAGVWSFGSTGKTVTIAKYEDGAKRVLYGACGTFTITKEAGKPGRVKFEMVGKYKDDDDASILVPTFPTVKPPFNTATFTLGTVAHVVTKWEVMAGNTTILREHDAAADGTALLGGAITTKRPTGSLTVEQKAKATYDFDALIGGDAQTLAIVVGSDDGNTIQIDSDAAQIAKAARASINGITGRDVGLLFTGLDAFTITFV